mmetsp:Transcript_8391/g.23317  ORF Transcript_8391/g.23317 Transcript_8391/m.23317 type:complete len:221 (-) Transcript_8391:2765-3427(-)
MLHADCQCKHAQSAPPSHRYSQELPKAEEAPQLQRLETLGLLTGWSLRSCPCAQSRLRACALAKYAFSFCRPKNFRTSSMRITGKEKAMTNVQSCQSSEHTAKILERKGMLMITKCTAMEPQQARTSQGLVQGGIWIREPSSERALNALSISMTTRTVNESVEALTLPAVKYEQGSFSKLRSRKGRGLKASQEEHFPQVMRSVKGTRVCWSGAVRSKEYQ